MADHTDNRRPDALSTTAVPAWLHVMHGGITCIDHVCLERRMNHESRPLVATSSSCVAMNMPSAHPSDAAQDETARSRHPWPPPHAHTPTGSAIAVHPGQDRDLSLHRPRFLPHVNDNDGAPTHVAPQKDKVVMSDGHCEESHHEPVAAIFLLLLGTQEGRLCVVQLSLRSFYLYICISMYIMAIHPTCCVYVLSVLLSPSEDRYRFRDIYIDRSVDQSIYHSIDRSIYRSIYMCCECV
jgi:hypothetical protein